MSEPTALALIGHWRIQTERDQPLTWGPDRAREIIHHIDDLQAQVIAEQAHVEQLRDTLAFNRTAATERAAEVAESNRTYVAALELEIIRLRDTP